MLTRLRRTDPIALVYLAFGLVIAMLALPLIESARGDALAVVMVGAILIGLGLMIEAALARLVRR